MAQRVSAADAAKLGGGGTRGADAQFRAGGKAQTRTQDYYRRMGEGKRGMAHALWAYLAVLALAALQPALAGAQAAAQAAAKAAAQEAALARAFWLAVLGAPSLLALVGRSSRSVGVLGVYAGAAALATLAALALHVAPAAAAAAAAPAAAAGELLPAALGVGANAYGAVYAWRLRVAMVDQQKR